MKMTESINVDSQSISGAVEQVPNLAVKVYNEQLNFWLDFIQKYDQGQTNVHPFGGQYFKEVFLKHLQKKFKLAIIFDNLMADTICEKLKKPQYMRFSMMERGKININQINLQEKSKLFQEQKWINLLEITQVLYAYKFISKAYYRKVEDFCYSKIPLQSQLIEFYKISKQKAESEGTERISMRIWTKTVSIDCKQFWTETIYEWPTLASRSKVIQQVYSFFQNYLGKKLERVHVKRLKQFISLTKQKVSSDYLYQVADYLCLFSYSKKVKAIEDQLASLQQRIKKHFQVNSHHALKIAQFQVYGSFRSKICLETSDVDLTLFVTGPDGQLMENKSQIEFIIKKVGYFLTGFQKSNDQKLQIANVFFVLTCRVPFIRVKFSNEMALRQMDIVVNNKNGVQNSRMLETYSENKRIRNLGVILKVWGKKNKLIDPQKLSSYGLILMLLYFLMSSGYLNFASLDQLHSCRFDTQLKIKETLVQTLIKFYRFYDRGSAYHENEELACLIFGCTQHSHLYNPGFIINIHDPFDGTNPGRLKQRDKFQFFHNVDQTLTGLQEAMTYSEVNRKQKINEIFGFQFEQISDSQPILIE